MPVTRKLAPRTTPAPLNLAATPQAVSVLLSWEHGALIFDFTRFEIFRDGVLLDDTTGTTYEDVTGTTGVSYDYTVVTVRTNPRSLQEYRSVPSATASGSWGGALADIEIVSITNATGGPTIAWNAVTGATNYQVERSLKPYTEFAQVHTTTGTSWQDTTGTAGVLYFYRVRVDAGASVSAGRVGTKYGVSATDAITVGALTLTRTFESIGIYLAYTGDADLSADARAEFKKQSDTTWRQARPLDQRSDGTTNLFLGSVFLCDPGTPYDIRVTVTDSSGGTTITDSKTTRAELGTLPTYADRTHLVAASGGDYTTLQAAVTAANSATADMVIGVKAGYWQRPTTTLNGNGHSITFVAENPAIDGTPVSVIGGTDYAPLDTGATYSVVYERFTAPTDSDLTDDAVNTSLGRYGKGIWTQETFGSYTVWKANIGVTSGAHIGYSQVVAADYAGAKAADPTRVAPWASDNEAGTYNLDTPAGFAAMIHDNLTQADGGWQPGGAGNTTLYLRLPDDIDPNDCYIWIGNDTGTGGTTGFRINGDDINVVGLSFRALPACVRVDSGADRVTVDHCQFHNSELGVYISPTSGSHATDLTVQYCRATDTRMWVDDPETNRGIAWRFIKQQIWLPGPVQYAANRVGSRAENHLLRMARGGQQVVVRYCTADGGFNGVSSSGSNTDWTAQRDVDVHDCLFTHLADNAFEPEGHAVNWRCWNYIMVDMRTPLSTDNNWGPITVFRGFSWRIGSHGNTDDGHPTNPSKAGEGAYLKTGGPGNPAPRWGLLHVTHWNDEGNGKGATDAISGTMTERLVTRNVIIRDVQFVTDFNTNVPWDDDGSLYASETNGIRHNGVTYNSTDVTGANSIAAFRTAIGSGTTTNKIGGTDYTLVNGGTNNGLTLIDGLFTDAANGDLSLAVGSAAIDEGLMVENISDLTGVNFLGSAPDRGWKEKA